MDCFEPIFRFLRSFRFQNYWSDTWDPKVMFSAPSGHSDVYFISCLKAGRFPQLGGANLTQKIGMQRLLFMEKSFQKGFQRGIAGATFKSSNLVCLPVYIYPFALSDMKISMITPLLLILLAGVDQEKMIVQKKLKSLCSIRHCSIISFFIIL